MTEMLRTLAAILNEVAADCFGGCDGCDGVFDPEFTDFRGGAEGMRFCPTCVAEMQARYSA